MKYLLPICLLFFCACSTKVSITSSEQFANKRIAIGDISIAPIYKNNQLKNDTLCACISSSLGSAMLPFFQEAGMHIIDLPQKNLLENIRVADSLKINYLPFIFLVFLSGYCSEPCSTLQLIGFLSGTWVYLE